MPQPSNYWDAKEYFANSSAQMQWALHFLQSVDFSHTTRLLDLGCGDGKITTIVANKLPQTQVVGLDPSPTMIEFAQNLLKAYPTENLHFVQGEARDLLIDEPFDTIISFSCIHWIPDQKQLFVDLAALMNKDGLLAFVCVPKLANNINAILDDVAKLPKWQNHLQGLQSGMYPLALDVCKNYLLNAGLEPLLVEIYDHPTAFADRTAFKLWVATWAAPIRSLPEELHDEFLEDVCSRYVEYHPQTSQSFIFDGQMLQVKAIKK